MSHRSESKLSRRYLHIHVHCSIIRIAQRGRHASTHWDAHCKLPQLQGGGAAQAVAEIRGRPRGPASSSFPRCGQGWASVALALGSSRVNTGLNGPFQLAWFSSAENNDPSVPAGRSCTQSASGTAGWSSAGTLMSDRGTASTHSWLKPCLSRRELQ